MRILALDISSAATGFALGDGTGPPVTGRAAFGGRGRGAAGAAFAKWLRDLLLVERPGLVVAEAALFTAGPRAGVEVARMLLGLSFMAEVVCEMQAVRHLDVPVQSWRKAFLGHGRPQNPKRAAIAMCTGLGWDVGGDDNRADAAGVWCWAHLHHGNSRAMHKLLSASSVRAMEGR